jgi:hypothetical protein
MQALYNTLNNIRAMTVDPHEIEVLCAIDNDDEVLCDHAEAIEKKFSDMNLKFHKTERSEHFTKDYWNFLAKKCSGRYIVVGGADCIIKTPGWNKIIYNKMSEYADVVGDDMINGLTKDGLDFRRRGENLKFPNFSCNPVVSKEHVEAMGYLFDERFWAWGSDHVITDLYRDVSKKLGQFRLVSLTDVQIVAVESIHTTEESDEAVLAIMRKLDKSYQKMIRIDAEHPYTMTPEDLSAESDKMIMYINNKNNRVCSPH